MGLANSIHHCLRRLFASLCAALLALCANVSTAAENTDFAERLRAGEAELAELESLHGPFDYALVEPLQYLIRLLQERSEHERVAELQERQLALLRMNLGLESPQLIPLLKEMVLTGIASGRLDSVGDHLQLIRNLSAHEEDPEALLRAMEMLAHWHLTGDTEAGSRERAENFFDARELIEDLQDVAEEFYGEQDPRLVPWLYASAMNAYQLVGLLNSADGSSGPTIRELVRHDGATRLRTSARGFSFNPLWSNTVTPVIEEGDLVGEMYLRGGIGKLDDMIELYEDNGNLEAQAMAEIYRSDFQLLMDRGTAFSRYREAQEMLREAGVPDARIDLFFSRPQLLPVNRFFPTLEEALAAQEAELAAWRPPPEDENLLEANPEGENPEDANPETANYVAPYRAWHESAPNVREPVSDNAFWTLQNNYHQVDLSFRISSRGRVSAVNIVSAEPDDTRSRRLARVNARELRFRPAIIDGRGQRLRDVQMRFLLPRRTD